MRVTVIKESLEEIIQQEIAEFEESCRLEEKLLGMIEDDKVKLIVIARVFKKVSDFLNAHNWEFCYSKEQKYNDLFSYIQSYVKRMSRNLNQDGVVKVKVIKDTINNLVDSIVMKNKETSKVREEHCNRTREVSQITQSFPSKKIIESKYKDYSALHSLMVHVILIAAEDDNCSVEAVLGLVFAIQDNLILSEKGNPSSYLKRQCDSIVKDKAKIEGKANIAAKKYIETKKGSSSNLSFALSKKLNISHLLEDSTEKIQNEHPSVKSIISRHITADYRRSDRKLKRLWKQSESRKGQLELILDGSHTEKQALGALYLVVRIIQSEPKYGPFSLKSTLLKCCEVAIKEYKCKCAARGITEYTEEEVFKALKDKEGLDGKFKAFVCKVYYCECVPKRVAHVREKRLEDHESSFKYTNYKLKTGCSIFSSRTVVVHKSNSRAKSRFKKKSRKSGFSPGGGVRSPRN